MTPARSIWLAILGAAARAAAVPGAAPAQVALFSLEAAAGELSCRDLQFGFHDDALDGPDALDLPQPPAPPADYLSLHFVLPDPGPALPNRWRCDIRAADSFRDQLELWELHVLTDRPAGTCTLILGVVAGEELPLELRVLGPDGIRRDLTLPGELTFPLTGPETVLWLELSSDVPVTGPPASLGSLKARYR